MANDNFLHDETGISTIVSEVKEEVSLYKENIKALETLVTSIEGSSAWVDESVKTSYVNTAKSYISSYNIFAIGLDNYVECLEKKSENLAEHESKFS